MRNLIIVALNGMTRWLDSQNERVMERRARRHARAVSGTGTYMQGGYAGPGTKYEFAGIIEPGMSICPKCIFIRDDAGNITEVIDCRTLNHQSLGG